MTGIDRDNRVMANLRGGIHGELVAKVSTRSGVWLSRINRISVLFPGIHLIQLDAGKPDADGIVRAIDTAPGKRGRIDMAGIGYAGSGEGQRVPIPVAVDIP